MIQTTPCFLFPLLQQLPKKIYVSCDLSFISLWQKSPKWHRGGFIQKQWHFQLFSGGATFILCSAGKPEFLSDWSEGLKQFAYLCAIIKDSLQCSIQYAQIEQKTQTFVLFLHTNAQDFAWTTCDLVMTCLFLSPGDPHSVSDSALENPLDSTTTVSENSGGKKKMFQCH